VRVLTGPSRCGIFARVLTVACRLLEQRRAIGCFFARSAHLVALEVGIVELSGILAFCDTKFETRSTAGARFLEPSNKGTKTR
jgi:hypothetical protein